MSIMTVRYIKRICNPVTSSKRCRFLASEFGWNPLYNACAIYNEYQTCTRNHILNFSPIKTKTQLLQLIIQFPHLLKCKTHTELGGKQREREFLVPAAGMQQQSHTNGSTTSSDQVG